jgi:Tfp pilus assembly protein PilE
MALIELLYVAFAVTGLALIFYTAWAMDLWKGDKK